VEAMLKLRPLLLNNASQAFGRYFRYYGDEYTINRQAAIYQLFL